MAYTTIDNPGEYFNTKLYTGNGGTQSITGVGFQPDWIWVKSRSGAFNHEVIDVIRGGGVGLFPNLENAESGSRSLSGFISDGFTLNGNDTTSNNNSSTYASWNWKESATAGFDIVSYTGNGSARTISHSLSAVPSMMIVKSRSSANKPWCVYHHKNTSAPETEFLSLNNTNATADNSAFWNDTAPTSSVFSVKNSNDVNENGTTYIAYLFSEKKGYSKFGIYTGNQNVDGTFVYLGFKPAFVMVKRTDSTSDWLICDNKRDPHNGVFKKLFPNLNQGDDSYISFDFVSNGFKIRSAGTGHNASGANMIYMAFAESPFVSSSGVPTTAR